MAIEPETPERFLNDIEAADLLGLSRSYLRKLRIFGGGCAFSAFGKAVRYRRSDLLAWAESKRIASTSQRAAA